MLLARGFFFVAFVYVSAYERTYIRLYRWVFEIQILRLHIDFCIKFKRKEEEERAKKDERKLNSKSEFLPSCRREAQTPNNNKFLIEPFTHKRT